MSTTAIIAHDAGGAEILSSWVRRNPGHYAFVLQGPAVAIFQRKLSRPLELVSFEDFEKNLATFDFVLTGTGYATDLEKKAVALSKGHVRVASFLDHWCNYKERFILDGREILPDEIWVGDEDAFSLALQFFPKEMIKQVANPYFADLKAEIEKMQSVVKPGGQGIRILYLTEPTSTYALKRHGNKSHLGYTEFDALKNYLQSLHKPAAFEKIRIRTHPSEERAKYAALLKDFAHLPLEYSSAATLVEDCLWADGVVGCQTLALVVALMAGKKVFSCIPRGGNPCVLPQKGIVRLFNP